MTILWIIVAWIIAVVFMLRFFRWLHKVDEEAYRLFRKHLHHERFLDCD